MGKGSIRLQIPSRKNSLHSAASSDGSFSATSGKGDEKNRFRFTISVAFWHANSCTQGFHRLATFSLATWGGENDKYRF